MFSNCSSVQFSTVPVGRASRRSVAAFNASVLRLSQSAGPHGSDNVRNSHWKWRVREWGSAKLRDQNRRLLTNGWRDGVPRYLYPTSRLAISADYDPGIWGGVKLIFDRMASTLLFGLAANTDNLTIGVAYGIKHRWIRWRHNLLIALVTTLVTLVAMGLGRQIREILPSRTPDLLGGALLLVFATWNFYQERGGASGRQPATISRFAERTSVGMGESLFLSGTLSINNVGLAVAGGIGGVGYTSAALSIFCFSVAMLALGQAAGSNVLKFSAIPQVLRYPISGNAVLALAGILMLAGY